MASLSPSNGAGKTKQISDQLRRDFDGAIVSWRNVKNGAEYATHEDGPPSFAVFLSIARLVNHGVDLRQWRCVSISTPQRIYADLHGETGSPGSRLNRHEGKMALTILRDAGS